MRRSPVKSDRHSPGDSEERRLGGAQPVLRAAQLTRTVRGHTLVDHVSFTVYPRDLLAVLGPSGAGKSSLLRMLNRLDEPTAGTVYLHHRSYREIPPRDLRRRVGFVSQRSYLFPGTVGENLCFGPEQCGSTLQEEEVAALLEAVGLVGYGERNVATLSGGEVQRVAVARALANQPEVHLHCRPHRLHPPFSENKRHSSHTPSLLLIVGNHHTGQTPFANNALNVPLNSRPSSLVQSRCGFVKQEHLWLVRQGPCNRDTLHLSTREGGHIPLPVPHQAHRLQESGHFLLLQGAAALLRPETEVLPHRPWDEIRPLCH